MGFIQPWPKEQEEELKRLYNLIEGGMYMSHGLIAITMGMNRSAVVGKIHRLKLTRDPNIPYRTHQGIVIDPTITSFKPKGPREKAEKPQTVRVKTVVNVPKFNNPRKPRAPQKMSGPGEYVGEMTVTACQVLDLNSKKCHFPIGHVGKEGFHFCGGPVYRGSYCVYHDEVCTKHS